MRLREAAVVDTDVVSYLFKDDTRAALYWPLLEDRVLIVSFMTVAETLLWAKAKGWGEERRRRFERHLSRYVVSPYDPALAEAWADASYSAQ